MDRRLKNLFSMWRWIGGQIFVEHNILEEASRTKNDVNFKIADKNLTSLVNKYDMLKQILIER